MKKINILISLALAIIFILAAMPVSAFVDDEYAIKVYQIKDKEDYFRLAENSISDAYTKNKMFVLQTDLEFSESEFIPITYFNGTFDGNDKTIKVSLENPVNSVFGIFRQIGPEGVVRCLNVDAEFTCGEIGENIGALCGINYGKIAGVNVFASINGKKNTGGIAGSNFGTITESFADGNVTGEHMTGGITGTNEGTIENSTSSCSVNNEYIEVTTYEISIISYLPEQIAKLLLPGEVTGVTDTGGIAGFSNGLIYNCKNTGSVGYSKNGFNVGGIAGRGTKLIIKCENEGEIAGKGDVGGIVGQLIPSTEWELAENMLEVISSDLKSLHTDVDSLLDYTDEYSETFNKNVKEVTKQLDEAEKNLNTFLTDGEKWIDSGVSNINDISDKISVALSYFSGASAEMERFAEYTNVSLGNISDASIVLSETIQYYDGNRDALTKAVLDLKNTTEKLAGLTGKYAQIYNNGAQILENGKEIVDLSSSLYDTIESYLKLCKTFYDMADGLIDFLNTDNFILDIYTVLLIAQLKYTLDESINKIQESLDLGIDSTALQISTILDINDTVESLIPLFADIADAIDRLGEGSEYFVEFLECLADASDNMSFGFTHFKNALSDVSSAFGYLSEGTTIKFEYIEDYVSDSQKDFFDSLESLNEKINGLADGISDEKLTEKVRKVSDSFFKLSSDIVDTMNQLTKLQDREFIDNTNLTYEDYLSSEEKDIQKIKGYSVVSGCINRGCIAGETNAGGICGIISIDVENVETALNLEGLLISGSRFIISATIQNCENHSSVTSGKEYAGGIVGKQIYGVINNCYSQSTVVSKGNYAGGICGYSESAIKNSKSRSFVSGTIYAGGIAGMCKNIENNLSVSEIFESKEYYGSIAGNCEGVAENNKYGVYRDGGINGFDISGKAEYDDSEKFMKETGLEGEITITFVAEDRNIEVKIPYDSKITNIPKIENKGDDYWVWNNLPEENLRYNITITGSYIKPKTTISTGEKIPSVLAEGKFYGGNELIVEDVTDSKLNLKSQGSFLKKITVTDYDGTIKVRTKIVKDGKLYSYKDGKTSKLNFTKDGSYIVFEIDNGSLVYYKASSVNTGMIILISVISVLAVAGTAAIIIFTLKKRKNTEQTNTVSE